MIKITIELLRHGNPNDVQHLGTVRIFNDCTGTRTRGNYGYTLSRRGAPDSVWKGGDISNFPRQALGAYDLLFRVLRRAVGERNQEEATNGRK